MQLRPVRQSQMVIDNISCARIRYIRLELYPSCPSRIIPSVHLYTLLLISGLSESLQIASKNTAIAFLFKLFKTNHEERTQMKYPTYQ